MHTTPFGKPRTALRLGSLFAASAACTILVGIQLGIAEHYLAHADATQVASRSQAVAQQTAATAAKQPRT